MSCSARSPWRRGMSARQNKGLKGRYLMLNGRPLKRPNRPARRPRSRWRLLEQERAENAHQRALNANLLRVSRERANADRNLKPKKERCGYVVVNSEEKETGFRAGSKRLHKVMLWETTIQTPYSVQMAEAVVRKQIEEDLFPAGKKAMIVGRIGITGKFNGSYEKFLEGKTQNPEDPFYNGNVVISRQQRLKRRFRLEYWEVAIVHTKPLGDIPEDLLPFEKKPVQGA